VSTRLRNPIVDSLSTTIDNPRQPATTIDITYASPSTTIDKCRHSYVTTVDTLRNWQSRLNLSHNHARFQNFSLFFKLDQPDNFPGRPCARSSTSRSSKSTSSNGKPSRTVALSFFLGTPHPSKISKGELRLLLSFVCGERNADRLTVRSQTFE
jgi:hypothetical protein